MTEQSSLARRRFLQLVSGIGVSALAGCSLFDGPDSTDPTATPRPAPSGPADATATLRAASRTVQLSQKESTENWLYNGAFPGPEIRVAEGNVFEATVTNELPEGTTIHWHGIPVANAMDGVPNVTQQPVDPGRSFTYTFRAEPPGTYFFHSHVGLQLDRGLLAPLIIEESDPHVEYDREYTVVVDDFLDRAPQPLSSGGSGGGPMGGGGPGGRGGMMGGRRPPYAGLLINGHLPADPQRFDVQEGERIRFRFINASSATLFRVQLGGHPMTITHADGRPVEPVTANSFSFGSGERYDAIVEATNPGTWEMRATAVDGNEPPAKAIIAYDGSTSATPTAPSKSGSQLSYDDLVAVSPLDGIDGNPDRTFDLTLSAGGQSGEWLIDGQAYPDADSLHIREGEHVRVSMTNRSPVIHPMHLHGHFFQVKNAVKDTVVVPGHMGQVTFDFVADNPGSWLFHCHNLYHLEAGMARVVQYVK
ncbi:multicopper oxidase family protein [Halocatena pleomorpha]|uniref:Multicopper oxidase family protein n=1 Tax=Halocatena pleomorpha TaxID=1785090 RepID=A0A3P3RKF7_9EURY|nr:multicopper oxidase family protein [Halocatena pleomorpha]RRJ34027.1 multicopper oxidase family protein [Halocatena pleomorpha]